MARGSNRWGRGAAAGLFAAAALAWLVPSPPALAQVTVPTLPPVTLPPTSLPPMTLPPTTVPLPTLPLTTVPVTVPSTTLPTLPTVTTTSLPGVTLPTVTTTPLPGVTVPPITSRASTPDSEVKARLAPTSPAGPGPAAGPGAGTGGGPSPSPAVTAPASGPAASPPAHPPATPDMALPARLRRATFDATRQFSLPLGLALVIVLFLVAQGRLGHDDPRLAAAPIDDDRRSFE
jgi:hypothetical protein